MESKKESTVSKPLSLDEKKATTSIITQSEIEKHQLSLLEGFAERGYVAAKRKLLELKRKELLEYAQMKSDEYHSKKKLETHQEDELEEIQHLQDLDVQIIQRYDEVTDLQMEMQRLDDLQNDYYIDITQIDNKFLGMGEKNDVKPTKLSINSFQRRPEEIIAPLQKSLRKLEKVLGTLILENETKKKLCTPILQTFLKTQSEVNKTTDFYQNKIKDFIQSNIDEAILNNPTYDLEKEVIAVQKVLDDLDEVINDVFFRLLQEILRIIQFKMKDSLLNSQREIFSELKKIRDTLYPSFSDLCQFEEGGLLLYVTMFWIKQYDEQLAFGKKSHISQTQPQIEVVKSRILLLSESLNDLQLLLDPDEQMRKYIDALLGYDDLMRADSFQNEVIQRLNQYRTWFLNSGYQPIRELLFVNNRFSVTIDTILSLAEKILLKLKGKKKVEEIEKILNNGPFIPPAWKADKQKIWIHKTENLSVRLATEDKYKGGVLKKSAGTYTISWLKEHPVFSNGKYNPKLMIGRKGEMNELIKFACIQYPQNDTTPCILVLSGSRHPNGKTIGDEEPLQFSKSWCPKTTSEEIINSLMKSNHFNTQ